MPVTPIERETRMIRLTKNGHEFRLTYQQGDEAQVLAALTEDPDGGKLLEKLFLVLVLKPKYGGDKLFFFVSFPGKIFGLPRKIDQHTEFFRITVGSIRRRNIGLSITRVRGVVR